MNASNIFQTPSYVLISLSAYRLIRLSTLPTTLTALITFRIGLSGTGSQDESGSPQPMELRREIDALR